jgi:hypothetical protein
VELLSERGKSHPYSPSTFIGISRPNLNPTGTHFIRDCTGGWFISASYGALWGNGKEDSDSAGPYKQGDRVGMLLDLTMARSVSSRTAYSMGLAMQQAT